MPKSRTSLACLRFPSRRSPRRAMGGGRQSFRQIGRRGNARIREQIALAAHKQPREILDFLNVTDLASSPVDAFNALASAASTPVHEAAGDRLLPLREPIG